MNAKADPTNDVPDLEAARDILAELPVHNWRDLQFDLLDLGEKQDFQEQARGAGEEPSLPVTHEHNPSLHARLCSALKVLADEGTNDFPDFSPIALDGYEWTPFARVEFGSLRRVRFDLLEEFASMVARFEQATKRAATTPTTGAPPKKTTPRTAAQQPRAKGGKFGKKR